MEELARLRALTTKITASIRPDAGVSTSTTGDKFGNVIAKIDELEREIDRDIDTFVEEKAEINRTLSKVTDPMEYNILSKRYILFETLEQIAVEISVSYRQTCRIHGDALQTVRKILEENEKMS